MYNMLILRNNEYMITITKKMLINKFDMKYFGVLNIIL